MSDEPYFGKAAKPQPEALAGTDPLALLVKEPAVDRPAKPQRMRVLRDLGEKPMLALVALATVWAGAQAYLAHPPRSVASTTPTVQELVKVKVKLSAVARAIGGTPTWNQLFDFYGLEEAVRSRTLEDRDNSENGHVPDPAAPIRASVIAIVLSS